MASATFAYSILQDKARAMGVDMEVYYVHYDNCAYLSLRCQDCQAMVSKKFDSITRMQAGLFEGICKEVRRFFCNVCVCKGLPEEENVLIRVIR